MYFVLVIYPQVDPLVEDIRRAFDPTVDVIEPHVAVVYPVPATLDRGRLSAHVRSVTESYQPFEIRFGGLHRSRDHWLFLTLGAGEEQVVRLHDLLCAGMLAPYRGTERAFVPHLGLGHFLRPGASYDWEHPREEDLDVDTFRIALRQAQPLLADSPQRIDEVHLVGVPDEVLEWSSGERATLPGGARVENVEAFPLGSTTP